MNTTLSYALDDILTYKLDIKAAINAKGGDAGDTLSYYATAISNLPTSSQRVQWPDGIKCQNSSPSVDWSQFDTSNVTNMDHMFSVCDTSNMTNLSYFDTSSATTMGSMFESFSMSGCINEYDQQTGNLISSYLPFDFSQFDTSNVTNMDNMFANCTSLTYLDLSSFNTSNVTNMDNMFDNCTNLTYLDVSSFNTQLVTRMDYMFANCNHLTYLDVSSFDTSNVTAMHNMFANCTSLTYLDLSSFNTYNVTSMDFMFYDNPYLTYINVSSFNTSNVTNMTHMFHCHRLSYIDVSSFDYTNVQSMEGMFYDSTATLINLSNANFATDDSCNTGMMFYVDWYDESAQTQHSWSNITRTVILNNVSNDVFNYLTKNTCPASEYGADYFTNSCSIAPNWIIHRDGNVYEYDDVNRQWSITGQVPTPEPEPEPQQSVILTSANIRTANGTSETVVVARYPYNNVNPINTIDENLKMSLEGDPAIRCHNDSNYIKLEAGCSFTLESSVDQIAQVIITLNLAYDNDTSELDVQPNEDNQLVFAEVYGMSFSFSAGSTPLYFTQIEVIYGAHEV